MKATLLFLGILWVGMAQAGAADKVELEPRTALPDNHPFYNNFVYEEIDTQRGLIVRKQVWTQRVRSDRMFLATDGRWYYYYEDRPGSKELKTRALPGAPAVPVKVKVEANPSVPVPSSVDDVVAPNRPAAKEEIPPQFTAEGPKKSVASTIKNMTAVTPEALTTVKWAESDKGSLPAEDLLPSLEYLRAAVLEWQADMHGRFGLCPVGKAEAEEKGTLETLYVPYAVVLGRIYVARMQLDRLISEVKTGGSSDTWARSLLLLMRRMEALDSQLWNLKKENEKTYPERILSTVSILTNQTAGWKPYSDRDSRIRVLRWQTIAENLQMLLERQGKLEKHVRPNYALILKASLDEIQATAAAIGGQPWKKSLMSQENLARRAYKATHEFSRLYPELSDAAEENRDNQKEYLMLLSSLGAAEDVRVMTYTILGELSGNEEKK